ncbi:MAG: hypothetical protein E6K13_00850 [Methanobacteriota archaeon]|nr:MAG: hypothetical protein E6K13_00850 [Euryarchaeota archaeon]
MGFRGLSRGDLLVLVALLATAGTVDAAYLTGEWYAAAGASFCDVGSYFSCSRVRESPFSAVGGVPTALIGVIGFGLILAVSTSLFLGRSRIGRMDLNRGLAVLAGIGAVIGLGLSLIEVFVIQAVCLLCAAGFALDLGILGLALAIQRQAATEPQLGGS